MYICRVWTMSRFDTEKTSHGLSRKSMILKWNNSTFLPQIHSEQIPVTVKDSSGPCWPWSSADDKDVQMTCVYGDNMRKLTGNDIRNDRHITNVYKTLHWQLCLCKQCMETKLYLVVVTSPFLADDVASLKWMTVPPRRCMACGEREACARAHLKEHGRHHLTLKTNIRQKSPMKSHSPARREDFSRLFQTRGQLC